MPGSSQVPNPARILRMVHVDNLPGVIAAGGMWAPNHAPPGVPYTAIHDTGVQAARSVTAVSCGPGGTIHDYVPFYFGPLSPMLLRLHTGRVEGYTGGQQPIAYLVSSVERVVAAGLPFVFTDGQANKRFTQFFSDPTDLDKVPWKQVDLRYWSDTDAEPDRMRRKQAEFLIQRFCPLGAIAGIAVIDAAMRARVEGILVSAAPDLPVKVKRDWYY